MPAKLHGRHAPESVNSGSIGTGFGLLIARQVIERHRGILILGNSLPGGACVQIKLPKQVEGLFPEEVDQAHEELSTDQ